MSAVTAKHRYSADEYLELERRAETKSEFHDGQIYAMTGASREHNLIATNAAGELRQQLRDFERGQPLTNDIDPKQLGRTERKRLRDGLRHIRNLKLIVETAVSSV